MKRLKQYFFTLVFIAMLCAGMSATAQICVPFTQRASQYTPSKTLYNIKGDFTMIGNTSLTLQNYGDLTQNGNNIMVYTDVDAPELTGLGGLPTFNSSSATLNFSSENGAVPSCSNIVYAGLYWTGRAKNIGPSPNTFSVTKNNITKVFDKRKIQLKGPTSVEYTEFTAAANDIYYPTNAHDFMYSAYTEVTDYVKANGIGTYFAADIALIEGNGGGTGFYGGWGMIVIYENSQMKHRDITIFDGHAFVVAGNANFDIPVTSFHTAQTGPVGVKLGYMSGEGDNGISGDYFQIKKHSDDTYISLNHALNTPTNFFNSSIETGGNARNPNLLNNSGLDIAMFEIPNPGNTVIGNNQTSTNFRYGSMGDTYIIFAVAMAVDAYIPDVEGIITATSIDGAPPGPLPTVEPGENIVYKVEVKNAGTEAIHNAKVTIPIPYNATYLDNSASTNIFITPAPSPNSVSFDPSMGVNGSLIWNIGTLPLQQNQQNIVGELTFTLRASENCALLKNTGCNNVIAVNGELSGTGASSMIQFDNTPLIQGYVTSGVCMGTAIPAPLRITLDATDYITQNCPGIPPLTSFLFCDPGNSIPVSAISSGFPAGTFFFNQYPVVSGSTIHYTMTNPFPATVGTSTYFAVPPGNTGCFYQFTIVVGDITSMPATENVTYCVGDTAQPLTATPSAPGYTLYYYTSQNSDSQISLVPSTATAGVFTYYVAEAQSPSCIGPKKAITVTILAGPAVAAPPASTIQACMINSVNGLPVSVATSMITEEQFVSAGGTIPANATITSITYSDVITGSCPKTLTRTFTVSSTCGAPQILTQTVTISDTILPTIGELPAASVIECGNPLNFAQATATDNCGDPVVLTYQDISSQGSCTGSYSVTRTWTATDICGNTATATQTINVEDTTPPSITPAQNITITCGSSTSEIENWLASNGQSVASSDCSQITWSNNYVPLAEGTSGVVEVTFTATDACGHEATTIATATFISPVTTPLFSFVTAICEGGTVPDLPDTSDNGIPGSWWPSVIDNSHSDDYIFTPADGSCSSETTVSFIVNPSNSTNAQAYAQCNSDIGLTIDLMAALPENVPEGGIWTDTDNTGGLDGGTFLPNGVPTGFYTLTYEVITADCPTTVSLEIEVDDDCTVLGCGNIIVHNAFSPNNDGVNDRFIIENIEDISCYPTNSLEIYNRWQVLVYETRQYDNRTRYFSGISEGRATIEKQSELPTGTYFYLLQYTTSDGKVVKKDGYLYLSR